MIENITSTDVGKRVMSKDWPPGTKDYGTLVRFSLGVPYVKWDYQPVQDAPYPTTGMLLDWSDEPVAEPESEDEDDDLLEDTILVSDAVYQMVKDVIDEKADKPADDDFDGEGGSFGGGGATGDFS